MSERAGTVFVAGATGYTGSALVSELVARGIPVVAHVRPESPKRDEYVRRFTSEGAKTDTTPWEADLTAALERHQAHTVVALLGTTRARGREASRRGIIESYETVDYDLTMRLLDSARVMNVRPRFVYLSALGANRAGRNKYLSVRKRVEAAIVASGLPYVIVRPALVTGPNRSERRVGERTAAKVADAVLDVLSALGAEDLRTQYRSMTDRELAAHLATVIEGGLDAAVLEPKDMRSASMRGTA